MKAPRPPSLDLFPFLSVLMGAVGVMLLVFCGTAIRSFLTSASETEFPTRPFPDKPGVETIYVVCSGEGTLARFPEGPVESSPPGAEPAVLEAFLDRIEERRDGRILTLLLKPSGINDSIELLNRLDRRETPFGKWPLPEDERPVFTRPGEPRS